MAMSDNASLPHLDPSDSGINVRRLVAGLLVAHVVLIAGLPLLTGRRLDVAVGRFPDANSVFWLLGVPAALSMLTMVIALSMSGRNSWRAAFRWPTSHATLSNRTLVVAGVVTVVALAGGVRGIGDAGFGLSAVLLVTILLIAIVEEFILRSLDDESLEARGSSVRHRAVVTSSLFIPVSLAHVLTEGATTFPVVILTAACGPALYLLTRSSGSSAVPVVVRTLVVFGLSVGRFGPDPQQRIEVLVAMVVVAVAAGVGVVGVRRLAAEPTATNAAMPRSRGRSVAFVSAVVLAPILALMAVPVPTSGLAAELDATVDYEHALERFREISSQDDDAGVFEPCQSQLLEHGRRTEQVVVLFHGLTNCPKQFVDLGQELFDDGANVLIMRAPRHGLTGTTSSPVESVGSVDLVGRLTAHELRDFADDAVDIAQGLGDEVVTSGLSMGGVLALWTAQFRPDVDRVVAVAPAISIPPVPSFITTAFNNLFSRVPNLSLPSTSKLDHAYHGESTGALAAMFLLAQATDNSIAARPAAAGEVIVVLNPTDNQVDNDAVQGLVTEWADADETVDVVFLPDIGLPHDVVDKDQAAGDVGVVYPILLPLIREGLSGQ